ncbi:hypothetical protein LUZ61_016203 [Rhynchospora tenuis]|uniref:Uncharacterized protein n=1 Tax=Rhynchospora tenuis TaxID=198213 RepID=A0AAD5Z538_9POAL|nr:hypothetical protein LUZ61_016203 [Rhynchospora tenuis]
MKCDGSSDASSREANSKLETNLTKPQLEYKPSAVHAELSRVTKLPSNISYAIHRMRVLHKLLYLLSIQRTVSQDEELELLFASLSL